MNKVAFDALVDLLAERTRSDQKTMMDLMFEHLERLNRPRMIDTLIGSLAKLDGTTREKSVDEIVRAAPRQSKVKRVLSSADFRYRLSTLDTLDN